LKEEELDGMDKGQYLKTMPDRKLCNSLHLLLEKVKKSGVKNSSPIKLTITLEYVLGILVCHFIPQSKTASAQYYKSFLQYHLHHAVREKHSELA
jgi:hypothetical protein